MYMEELRQLAEAFRTAIEDAISDNALTKEARGTTLLNFPVGCCELASDLLAQFLLDNGIETQLVHGEYQYNASSNRFPHSWLKTEDGAVIDITADQFSHNPVFRDYHLTPCYVGEHNSFYDLFKVGIRIDDKFTGLNSFNTPFSSKALSLYNIILQFVPDSEWF